MTATSNIFNIKAVMGVIVMEEVVELFSSEGNFFCKVIFRLLFNTKALHPLREAAFYSWE